MFRDTVLVTNATSEIGINTIDHLLSYHRKRKVSAAFHPSEANSPAAMKMKEKHGSEITFMDMEEMHGKNVDILADKLKHVAELFIVNNLAVPPEWERGEMDQAQMWIKAASRAQVPFVIFLTILSPKSRNDKLGHYFLEMEAELAHSGLNYFLVRVGFPMQHLLFLKKAIAQGRLPFPIGDNKLAPVDLIDVGKVASHIIMQREEYKGEGSPSELSLVGPELLSGQNIASMMCHELGAKVEYCPNATLSELAKMLVECGLDEAQIDAFMENCRMTSDGKMEIENPCVKEVLASEANTLESWMKTAKSAFIAAPPLEE